MVMVASNLYVLVFRKTQKRVAHQQKQQGGKH
jgi:hypothetical protein